MTNYFNTLYAFLKNHFSYNFSRQQAGYIIHKILGLEPNSAHKYDWDMFWHNIQFKSSEIKAYVEKLVVKEILDKNKQSVVKPLKQSAVKPLKQDETPKNRDESNDTPEFSDMEKASEDLLDRDIYDWKYENESKQSNMIKKVIISEDQYNRLFENIESEDLYFHNGKVGYKPGRYSNMDDAVFKPGTKDFNYRTMILPRSKVKAYILYDIKTMKVNKALKHKTDMNGNQLEYDEYDQNNGKYSSTIDWFLKRSVMYIKSILGQKPIDYITYPQSSSNFNEKMVNKLLDLYPKSEGIKIQPNLFVKNIKGIKFDEKSARDLGFTDSEISKLKHRVEEIWPRVEDIRQLRYKIKELRDEITNILSQSEHRRGRKPQNKIDSLNTQINAINDQISGLRKGIRGRDASVDQNGNVKSWQIKSVDDKVRRCLDNIFTINPEFATLTRKFQGKSFLIFDDNISSGVTLDQVCMTLKKIGVNDITVVTLGQIDPTIYKISDRSSRI